jgi:uncharacterized protein YkwD
MVSLLLCLVLGASLFAFPAFADSTVIVIGGAVEQNLTSTTTYNSSGTSAVIVSDSSGGTVIVSGTSNTAAQSATSAGSVVVMPDGQVQQIALQPIQQTQTVVQGQGIQTSSAQTAAAATPTVVVATQNTTQTITVSSEAPNDLSKNILAELNATRAAYGIPALKYSADLQAAADTRAMESVQNFSHLRPNGSGCETAVTVDYMVTGENLIQVTSEFATAAIMMDTWMNSPTHRNNILLSSFTDVAVGIYVVNGTTYVSTVFVG